MANKQNAVDATVVGIDPEAGPLPAVVVSDTRDKGWKRLSVLALFLILLFFVISSFVQSARNGRQLDEARKDNHALVISLSEITLQLSDQAKLTKELREAIRKQNEALLKAGLPTIPLPGEPGTIVIRPVPSPTPGAPSSSYSGGTQSRPQPQPTSKHSSKPTKSPKPKPTATPTPSPTPVLPVGQLLCRTLGVCLKEKI